MNAQKLYEDELRKKRRAALLGLLVTYTALLVMHVHADFEFGWRGRILLSEHPVSIGIFGGIWMALQIAPIIYNFVRGRIPSTFWNDNRPLTEQERCYVHDLLSDHLNPEEFDRFGIFVATGNRAIDHTPRALSRIRGRCPIVIPDVYLYAPRQLLVPVILHEYGHILANEKGLLAPSASATLAMS